MADTKKDPIALWQGAVSYYGALCAKPDWKWLRPLFELTKQISTSRFCVNFAPTIIDEGLEISRDRDKDDEEDAVFLKVRLDPDGLFHLDKGTREGTRSAELTCSPESGFPTIASVLKDL